MKFLNPEDYLNFGEDSAKDSEFEEKIKSNEIFEYDMFNNNYYGTSRKLFSDGLKDADVVMKDISVMGFKNIEEELGDELNIIAVFLTQTKKELRQRLIGRGESPEKIKNRLNNKCIT